jgi:oxygen-independent coproporphyrinogen-3 oxidase
MEEKINSPFDNISEAVFTGLRRREGITYEEAKAAYLLGSVQGATVSGMIEGAEEMTAKDLFWDVFRESRAEADEYADRGLLVMDDQGLRLTEQGVDISNGIMSLFV